MKVDLDMSVVSRFFQGLLNEFRQKKLWPVAAVLLAAIVAVPVLLSSSPSSTPGAQASLPTPPPATGSAVPTLNVQTTPTSSHPTGPAHNPFAQGAATSSTSTATTTAAASNPVSPVTGGSSTSSTSPTSGSTSSPSAGSSTTTSSSTPAGTPPSITGNSKPKPAPTGLRSTESYDVALAITNSAGGVNTVDPLARLSLIPNNQEPLLVDLGVLQGGSKVLFAVEPGTVLNGPGVCIPGPIDCEILSLGQDQTEAVSSRDSGANALFAITGVTAVSHASAAAADVARDAKSAAGQGVLDGSDLPAVSLFKYEPSVGSVVDLRNLTVGG